jgi:hypothetical protein
MRIDQMKKTACFLMMMCCLAQMTSCISSTPSYFEIQDGQVWFTNLRGERRQVSGADPTTFKYIGGIYGKDKQHVFYAYSIVESADPTSFTAFDTNVGRDAKAVYYQGARCADCDLATFRKIDDDWYADAKAVYYQGARCAGCDPATFRKIGDDWYADKNTVYLNHSPMPGIDASSFKQFNFWYAKDEHHVFYSGRPLIGADPTSFKLRACKTSEDLNACGEDKNRCYWSEHPVPCDGKSYFGVLFPRPMADISTGKALLADYPGPIKIDGSASQPVIDDISAGYWRVDAGKYELSLKCLNDYSYKKITLDIKSGHIYRLKLKDGTTCGVDIEHPILLQGRIDGPEIQIKATPNAKPESQIELAPNSQTLTAICREVTRSAVLELPVDLALDLEAGRIYKLEATFEPTKNKCDVRAIPAE